MGRWDSKNNMLLEGENISLSRVGGINIVFGPKYRPLVKTGQTNQAGKTGQTKQDRLNRTGRQDRQNRTGGTGQADRTARTGQLV
jgi:hypothetical protein